MGNFRVLQPRKNVEAENTSSLETVRPLSKSYLRSCLFLLNQVTDGQILVFVLTRLKASTVFFAAFPLLIGRLIKVSSHLWVTGEENLSLCLFFILRDVASQLGSECLDKCLSKTYKAFVAHLQICSAYKFKALGVSGRLHCGTLCSRRPKILPECASLFAAPFK